MYGAYPVFNFGLVWFFVWSLVAGFSTNYQMLIAARALGGLGPAAFLPTSIMLIGKIYRPGPRKNVVFGLWSAFAPVGFYIGIIIGGATTQLLTWRVYFWIGAGIMAAVSAAAFMTVPNDMAATRKENAHITMDWWGVATIVPGLVMLTFAITDGAHAENGFATPYIIATCVCGVVFLAAAVYVEGWVAKQPLLPFDLFEAKYMKRLTVGLFFIYGIFGIFLFYASVQ
jgi:MFS family permease